MNVRSIAGWILAVLLALVFLGSGLAKLTSQAMPVGMFALFGLPPWFMYLTGALEVVTAVLLLVPRTSGIGAALVVCIMIGATIAHATHGQISMIGATIVIAILAVVLGNLRGWPRGTAPLASVAR